MKKILIIDDENRTRDLIAKMIDSFGFDVVAIPEGENVQSAVKAIKKHQPDIVFLDILVLLLIVFSYIFVLS